MLPHRRQPRRRRRAGAEVARPRVLDVGDRRRDQRRQAGDGGTKPLDVGGRGVDAEAGAYRTRHLAAVATPRPGAMLGDLARAQAEKAHQVGVGAEAPVAHADGVFEGKPCCHKGMGEAIDGEGRYREGLGAEVGAEEVDAGDGRQPSAESDGELFRRAR